MKYKVWDELNADEPDAQEIEATEPEHAATEYGVQDHDGASDGLYHDGAQPISVRCLTTGALYRFDVSAEMEPRFWASEVKDTTGAAGGKKS